jgi:hypothetical protein
MRFAIEMNCAIEPKNKSQVRTKQGTVNDDGEIIIEINYEKRTR